MAEISTVAVVGAGTMGSQIALQTAYAGRHHVVLVDSSPEQLEDRRRLEGGPGAPAALKERVERGDLGRKSGRGFYDYESR